MKICTTANASEKFSQYASALYDTQKLQSIIVKCNQYAVNATMTDGVLGFTKPSKNDERKLYSIEYIEAKRDAAQRALNTLVDRNKPKAPVIGERPVTTEHTTSYLSTTLYWVKYGISSIWNWFTAPSTFIPLGVSSFLMFPSLTPLFICSIGCACMSRYSNIFFSKPSIAIVCFAVGFGMGLIAMSSEIDAALSNPNHPWRQQLCSSQKGQ